LKEEEEQEQEGIRGLGFEMMLFYMQCHQWSDAK